MLEPIPFWGMIEVDLPVKTYAGNKPNHIIELTDDEIKALWRPMPDTKTYESDILKFARAILRKAQKK